MQTEIIDVEELIPYANNSRTHSSEQVAMLASIIRKVGFRDPVEIDENNTILVGHGRVLAAKKLGMTEIPCIRHTDMSENDKKSYIIANNKTALMAGWDEELLKIEFEALGDDVEFTGFSVDEINLITDGWNSDLDLPSKDGSNLDGIKQTIKIEVEQDAKQFANEVITNALDGAGIEYELK